MGLKDIREGKGWTQTQLAKATGIPQPNISAYERWAVTPDKGKTKNPQHMELSTALRLADALGCDPHDLLD